MISFVVIGKNEGKNLRRCFDSIYKAIELNELSGSEVIYVDSASSDDSIAIAKSYDGICIYEIEQGGSPAAGRNVGWRKASNEMICFIDGDNELNPMFFMPIINDENILEKGFFIGNHEDWFYTYTGEFISKSLIEIKKRVFPSTYGWFIIKRSMIEKIGGYDEAFRKPGGEDYDFFIRLKRSGIEPAIIDDVIVRHHTVSYLHPRRCFKMLADGSVLYARSFLYRKHLFDKDLLRLFLRREYSLLGMLFFFGAALFFMEGWIFLLYMAIVVLKSFGLKGRPWYEFFIRLAYFPLRDVFVFFGFVFFWPKKKGTTCFSKLQQGLLKNT